MPTIKAAHYDETEERFARNPIVIEMAEEIPSGELAACTHEDGSPNFNFMQGANAEYDERLKGRGLGPSSEPRHIGAVAHAILKLRRGEAG